MQNEQTYAVVDYRVNVRSIKRSEHLLKVRVAVKERVRYYSGDYAKHNIRTAEAPSETLYTNENVTITLVAGKYRNGEDHWALLKEVSAGNYGKIGRFCSTLDTTDEPAEPLKPAVNEDWEYPIHINVDVRDKEKQFVRQHGKFNKHWVDYEPVFILPAM